MRLGDQPIQSLNREGLYFSKPMEQRYQRNDELFVFAHDFQVDARILAVHHHDAVQVLHLEILWTLLSTREGTLHCFPLLSII